MRNIFQLVTRFRYSSSLYTIKTGNSQDGTHLDLQVVVVAVAAWYLDNTLVVHMRQAYMGQPPFLHSKTVAAAAAVGIADLDTMEVAEY